MSERFFCHRPITGDSATLVDQEAHHLLHVMRLKAGARVVLFDGSGKEFVAEVRSPGRREVGLAVLSGEEVDRELAHPLTAAVAMPKGDRQRWLVEKLTELGVARLVPIETERSVAVPSASAIGKLERAVIEASKQCRRNRLMEIAEPSGFADLLRAEADAEKWIAHPSGNAFAKGKAAAAPPSLLAIGPEGGFTEQEYAAALAFGWRGLSLGPRILRTESAAIACTVLATQAIAS